MTRRRRATAAKTGNGSGSGKPAIEPARGSAAASESPFSEWIDFDQDDIYVVFVCEEDPRPDPTGPGPEREDHG